MSEDIELLKGFMKKTQGKLEEVQVIAEMSRANSTKAKTSPRGEGLVNDQLKRVLALIENNSQAMTL